MEMLLQGERDTRPGKGPPARESRSVGASKAPRFYCSAPERQLRLPDVTELWFRELAAMGVKQTWFTTSGQRNRVAYLLSETISLLKQLSVRPDAIVIRDKYWAAALGLWVARRIDAKFIVWLSYPFPEHDQETSETASGARRLLKKTRAWLGRKMLYQYAMPRADHCFVQSEEMARGLHRQWGILSANMTAVPMGIARRHIHMMLDSDLSVDPNFIVHLGSLAAVRKLEILIDALALIPGAQLQFVGDGDTPDERSDLIQYAVDKGLADRVLFTGQLSQRQALRCVQRAAVCVCAVRADTPTLRVASPTKLIEYMAMGKAVVANSHPAHNAIFWNAATEVLQIVEWSAADFAEGISGLLKDPARAARMGAAARAWVIENRTYSHIALMVHERLMRVLA